MKDAPPLVKAAPVMLGSLFAVCLLVIMKPAFHGPLLFTDALFFGEEVMFSREIFLADLVNFLKVLAIIGAFGAVVAILRYAVGTFGAVEAAQPGAEVRGSLQSMLARPVVVLGTLSILALSFGVLLVVGIAAAFITELQNRLDTIVMTVFTAVLPVFATWVGTVLAFVYAKENFEAAAKASERGQPGSRMSVIHLMRTNFKSIPTQDLASFEANEYEEEKTAKDVFGEFADVSRLPVVRESDGMPILVLIRGRLESFISGPSKKWKMKDFLDTGDNRKESERFDFIASTATLADALAKVNSEKRPNMLFVTASGSKTERVIGCLFDDDLRVAAKD